MQLDGIQNLMPIFSFVCLWFSSVRISRVTSIEVVNSLDTEAFLPTSSIRRRPPLIFRTSLSLATAKTVAQYKTGGLQKRVAIGAARDPIVVKRALLCPG